MPRTSAQVRELRVVRKRAGLCQCGRERESEKLRCQHCRDDVARWRDRQKLAEPAPSADVPDVETELASVATAVRREETAALWLAHAVEILEAARVAHGEACALVAVAEQRLLDAATRRSTLPRRTDRRD